MAYDSPADILFYGGAAGGGKTDLGLGLAGTRHRRSIIFRRVFPNLKGIVDRSRQLFSLVGDYNDSKHVWKLPGDRIVEFGSLQHEHSKTDYQGQPHDLYVFDEAPEFTETQVRFVIGWNRTTIAGQRCRSVFTGNPPTNSDGEWIIRFFAPWLDESHPHPALPGELRWFTTIDGKDVEVDEHWRGVDEQGEIIVPVSRTFIRALLKDNRFQSPAYRAVLQSMPEPLRSQMLFGDFRAGREDAAYQVIPSAWVDAAQKRWREDGKKGPQSALGVDVARGGKDKTTIAPRYGNWFGRLRKVPGKTTPDGAAVAALVMEERRDDAVVNIDVLAVGSSPYDSLKNGWIDEHGAKWEGIGPKSVPMNAAQASEAHDKANQLAFVNQRAEWWWGMREDLDPASGQDLALPPDPELKADLCAPRWKPTPRGIQIEGKDEIIKRIGRSPDTGDAVVMARAIKWQPGAGWVDYARGEIAAQKKREEEARKR